MNRHNSKKSLVVSLVVVFLVSLAFLSGAISSAAEKEIKELGIGMLTIEEVQLTAKRFEPVVRALKEITGVGINWYMPTSFASLIEAHLRGFVHIVYYGPRSYINAHEISKGMVEAFAQLTWGEGAYRPWKPGYQSYVIVKADSPYQSVEDLKGKVFALVDPASTSGDLIPKVELGQRLGMKISKFFGKTFYAGAHDAAAKSVLEGRADAAAQADIAMAWAVQAKQYTTEDFRIIWKSSLLPLDPFAWRKDLPSDLKKKIVKALLSLNESDYGKEFLKVVKSDSIVLVEDSAYDSMRKIYAEIEKWE